MLTKYDKKYKKKYGAVILCDKRLGSFSIQNPLFSDMKRVPDITP